MSYELATVTEQTSLPDTISYMKAKRVRRVPVVDNQGSLAGIITTDDVIELIAEQLQGLASLYHTEQKQEIERRSVC